MTVYLSDHPCTHVCHLPEKLKKTLNTATGQMEQVPIAVIFNPTKKYCYEVWVVHKRLRTWVTEQ